MKNSYVFNLINSFRLTATIPAALLVHLGYKLAGAPTNWLLVLEIFIIATATMITNDYFDRGHDAHRKNKPFALANEYSLLGIMVLLWATAIITSFFFCFKNSQQFTILLWVCIGIGLAYSWSRKIVFLPTILVALASSIPILFGFLENGYIKPIFAFFIIACFMTASELIKDNQDCEADTGYKKTLVSEKYITKGGAMLFAAFWMFCGLLISLIFLSTLQGVAYALFSIGGAINAVTTVMFMATETDRYRQTENLLDTGTILMLIALLI